jgi:LysR family transcriptional regulator for metE and metH
MLGMVASQRGVALIPEWLVERSHYKPDIGLLPPAGRALDKQLYLVIRREDRNLVWMNSLFSVLEKHTA